MEQRYDAVLLKTSQLLSEGYKVFSPIVHCHSMAMIWDMPKKFEFWQAYDEHMIDLADELWVLTLEGWRVSRGVQAEIEYANKTNTPIIYVNT